MTANRGSSPRGASNREGFMPCPTCKQYSHSIDDDRLAEAFRHFQMLHAHPLRGHPMGYVFDEQTRDAAQVLMAAAQGIEAGTATTEGRGPKDESPVA